VLSSDSTSQNAIQNFNRVEKRERDTSEMIKIKAKDDRDRFKLIIEMTNRLKMKISRTKN
jgi:hypothetical protein